MATAKVVRPYAGRIAGVPLEHQPRIGTGKRLLRCRQPVLRL